MNDFDIWQRALKKIDLTTAVAPVVRGVMLVEDNQVDAYNKIQKLLGCPELEASHRFLYSLDPTELTEAESTKIANLYRLGLERGFISDDEDEDDDSDSETDERGDNEETNECGDEDTSSNSLASMTQNAPVSVPEPSVPATAYTVLYSAMRNGEVKTGEAFSNAITTRSAKADVISKLERAGYQNISILAIEAGDPDAKDCPNTYQKMSDISVPDYSVSEDDYLDGRHHNFHVDEADDKKDDEESDNKDSDTSDEEKTDDKSEEKDDKSDGKADDKKEDKDEDKPEKKEDAEEPDEKLKDDAKDDEDSEDDENSDEESDETSNNKKDDKKELSTEQKGQLKDSYKKAFKAALQKCKFETSFSELSLEQKIDFFTALAKAWGDKADPSKFMTDKELDQLEKITVKPQG